MLPGDHHGMLEHAGRRRTYVLHLPPAHDGRTPLPLVVVLHGGGGNAGNAIALTGFSDLADRDAFAVVYPNGTGRLEDRLLTWNSGNCCGYALEHQVDDVGFLRALLQTLEAGAGVDPRRVYVTGISNGGMLAYRAACELSGRIAAIAPVAAAMNVEQCAPAHPLSVVAFHGTADENVRYEGGRPRRIVDLRHPRVDQPVSHAISFWVGHNGCAPAPRREEQGNVLVETYAGGREGTEVVLYTLRGGGHSWPGGAAIRPWIDPPSPNLAATEQMWEFFRRHARK